MTVVHHTAGPWHAARLARSWGVYDADGTKVAEVGGAFGVAAERRAADAAAIAAVPEMRSALELVLKYLRSPHFDPGNRDAMAFVLDTAIRLADRKLLT